MAVAHQCQRPLRQRCRCPRTLRSPAHCRCIGTPATAAQQTIPSTVVQPTVQVRNLSCFVARRQMPAASSATPSPSSPTQPCPVAMQQLYCRTWSTLAYCSCCGAAMPQPVSLADPLTTRRQQRAVACISNLAIRQVP